MTKSDRILRRNAFKEWVREVRKNHKKWMWGIGGKTRAVQGSWTYEMYFVTYGVPYFFQQSWSLQDYNWPLFFLGPSSMFMHTYSPASLSIYSILRSYILTQGVLQIYASTQTSLQPHTVNTHIFPTTYTVHVVKFSHSSKVQFKNYVTTAHPVLWLWSFCPVGNIFSVEK